MPVRALFRGGLMRSTLPRRLGLFHDMINGSVTLRLNFYADQFGWN
jgi:hypothetical protein